MAETALHEGLACPGRRLGEETRTSWIAAADTSGPRLRMDAEVRP